MLKKIHKTYPRFCKKCGKYFQPLTKYSYFCQNCKHEIKSMASKRQKKTQKGQNNTYWRRKIKKKDIENGNRDKP